MTKQKELEQKLQEIRLEAFGSSPEHAYLTSKGAKQLISLLAESGLGWAENTILRDFYNHPYQGIKFIPLEKLEKD